MVVRNAFHFRTARDAFALSVFVAQKYYKNRDEKNKVVLLFLKIVRIKGG